MLTVTLDIFRGLAAMFVFCFHLKDVIAQSSPLLGRIAGYGDAGVPIFFVISGYCMSASAAQVIRREGRARDFLRKRFLRIYPPFWASVLVVMLVPYALAGISAAKTGSYILPVMPWHDFHAADWMQVFSLSRIFLQDAGGLYARFEEINIVYWTLAIEFQFYLVVFLALWWRRHYTHLILAVSLLSLVAFIAPEIKWTGFFLGFWPMFALGFGLHYLLSRGFSPARLLGGHGRLLSLLALALLSGLLLQQALAGDLEALAQAVFRDADFGYAVVIAVMLWLMSAFDQSVREEMDGGHPLLSLPIKAGCFLGAISYSIYLLHAKLYQLPDMLARQLFARDQIIYPVVLMAGTVALSWIFYRYCERPFISRRSVNPLTSA